MKRHNDVGREGWTNKRIEERLEGREDSWKGGGKAEGRLDGKEGRLKDIETVKKGGRMEKGRGAGRN